MTRFPIRDLISVTVTRTPYLSFLKGANNDG